MTDGSKVPDEGPPPLLEAENVGRVFRQRGAGLGRVPWLGTRTEVHAVEGVHLRILEGETVGLVGESGCGKSTLGRLLLRLLPPTTGAVRLDGRDLASMSAPELRRARRRVQMIFQDNASALDPRMTVGRSVAEGLQAQGMEDDAARLRDRVAAAFERVGLDPSLTERYPHELSGGQRQRVGIARALVVEPDLIVADEPVSALDVSVRAQIVDLLADLHQASRLTLLMISHDLEIVAHLCRRLVVMYLGRVVEEGPTEAIAAAPAHPYTETLLRSIPVRKPRRRGDARLPPVVAGEAPDPVDRPPGCAYHPRCPRAVPGLCEVERPALIRSEGRLVACHRPLEGP